MVIEAVPVIVGYEELGWNITLDPAQEKRDTMLLYSAHRTVCGYTKRELCSSRCRERLLQDCGYFTMKEYPVTEVYSIKTVQTGTGLTVQGIQENICGELRLILTAKTEDGPCIAEYAAGYTAETVPGDLKEALIKTYLYKRRLLDTLETGCADTGNGSGLSGEVKDLLEPYRRKPFLC